MTTLKNRWSTQFWVIWAWFPQFWVIAQIWVFTQIWGIPDGFIQIWVCHSNLSSSLKFEGKLCFSLKFEWRTQISVKSKTTYYRPSIHNVIFVVVGIIRIIGDHIQVAIHYLCFFTINAWQFQNCKEGFITASLKLHQRVGSCSCHLSFLSLPSAITKLSPHIRHLNYNINFILYLSL